jgi:hypothetical protein
MGKDAQWYADERIVTQRCCYGNLQLASKKHETRVNLSRDISWAQGNGTGQLSVGVTKDFHKK